ncbi:MAG: glycerol-3-phosphate dehydrogenase/oxidase [Gaiellaceae bacterium]
MTKGVLSPGARAEAVARLEREQLDVLVVGGGITGVGVALDAVSRGLSVGLIEAHDLAAGTSSRSSKLIHGGLRYLEMLEFKLVREALRERRLLLTRLAPHLVRPVDFLFPLKHRGWERPYVGAGLLLYDAWAGRHLPRARHLSRRAALAAAPALRPDSLVGAVRFSDAQEDDALYAVYVARTAAARGASIATRVRAASFLRGETGRILGVRADDCLTGRPLEIRARHTIVAVGVATDRVLQQATGRAQKTVRPSKGVHLIVPRSSIPMRSGLFMRTEKSVFHAIPWASDYWLLGDTDTEWDGDVDTPVANRTDVEYVLAKVNSVLRRPVRQDEILGVFAGLRPLVAAEGTGDTTRLSREHRLFSPVPGLTAIAGGKYTTYRVMARDAVDVASRDLGSMAPSTTDRLPLLGAAAPPDSGDRIRLRHGGCADEVLMLAQADPELAAPLAGAGHYIRAEAVHAVTHQGALDLDDILSRRTRVSIEAADRGRSAAASIASLVAPALGWSEARAAEELERYIRLRDAEAAAEAAPDDAAAAAAYRAVMNG